MVRGESPGCLACLPCGAALRHTGPVPAAGSLLMVIVAAGSVQPAGKVLLEETFTSLMFPVGFNCVQSPDSASVGILGRKTSFGAVWP